MAPRRKPKTPFNTTPSTGPTTSASAPTSRVYESAPPAPRQLHFPPRARVQRTYGRRSLPAPGVREREEREMREMRQQTLTQVGYVRSSSGLGEELRVEGEDEDGEDGELELELGVGEDNGKGKGLGEEGGKGKALDKRRRSRRRTVGDAKEVKMERGSSFHTQTLTQFLGVKGLEEEGPGGLRVEDDEEDGGGEDLELPRRIEGSAKRRSPRNVVADPQTPSHKRIKVNIDEVPSSQPTPFTPMLDRYSPGRSPLREKSTNVNAPTPTAARTVPKRPTTLVIQDSYSQGSSSIFLPSSSVAAETPKKEDVPKREPLAEIPVGSLEFERRSAETPKIEDVSQRVPLAEIPVGSLELGRCSASVVDDVTPTTRRVIGAERTFIEIPDSEDELQSIASTPCKTHSTLQTPLKAQEDFEILGDPPSGLRGAGVEVTETPTSQASLGRSDKENAGNHRNSEDDGELTASEGEPEPEPGTPTPTQRKPRSQTVRSTGRPSQRTGYPVSQARDSSQSLGNRTVRNGPSQVIAIEPEGLAVLEAAQDTPTRAPRKLTSQPTKSVADREKTPRPTAYLEDDELTASEAEEETLILPRPTPLLKARKSTPDISTSEDSNGEPPGTPTPVVRRVQINLPPSSPEEVYKETPRKSAKKSSPIYQRHTQARSQYYSQGLESQRVPLEVIRSLGPQTDRSDILISIQPEIVDEIVKGIRDHEFRSYKFPFQVSRCWIYATLPVGEVKYMATLGPGLEPGQIDIDSGVGNAEFNAGASGFKYAHKLLQVYQLNNPIPLADMPDNGLGNGSPQKYRYVPPAIVGQLLANLRCPLFAEGDEEDEDEEEEELREAEKEGAKLRAPEAGVTVSQELEEQLRSDIIHSTQLLSSTTRPHHQAEDDVIPASQDSPSARPGTARRSGGASARSPVPPARSSQRIRDQQQQHQRSYQKPQPQRPPSSARKGHFVRPSQATTASDVSSSPGHEQNHDHDHEHELEKTCSSAPASVPRPLPESSASSLPSLPDIDMDMDLDVRYEDDEEEEDDSLIRRSGTNASGVVLASSSQAALPPDSLLADEVGRAPPPVVWDSEDEEGV